MTNIIPRALLAAALSLFALPEFAAAANITFENAVLKAYVVANYDENKDGEISEAEALLVTKIAVSGGYDDDEDGVNTKISSFADIANFVNLDTLDCSSNYPESLDLSENTKLLYLACSGNKLTGLDLSKNTQLKVLDCRYNLLESLDLSKNTTLISLDCSDNSLTSLGVSNNVELEFLICPFNSLKKLDVSKNTNLGYLECDNNSLTNLDVTKNTRLWHFDCKKNQIHKLDARRMTSSYIWCGLQDFDGDGTSSATEVDTLFLTDDLLKAWMDTYGSSDYNVNVVAYGQSSLAELTLNVNDAAMGSVTGAGTYVKDSAAAITATPKTGYVFVKWSDGVTAVSRTITMTKDSTLTATFKKSGTSPVAILASAPSFGVSVTGHLVNVNGIENGAAVRVFDLQGRPVLKVQSLGGSAALSVPGSGVYIVRVGNKARKIAVK